MSTTNDLPTPSTPSFKTWIVYAPRMEPGKTYRNKLTGRYVVCLGRVPDRRAFVTVRKAWPEEVDAYEARVQELTGKPKRKGQKA